MNRTIGVFDSGVGGLTVLKELIKILPDENYIYIGDTLNVPYGPKSSEEINKLVKGIINYFIKRDVKAIVIACNTISAVSLNMIKEMVDIPVVATIKAAANSLGENAKNIGLIATEATINSNAYDAELKAKNIYKKPAPKLVELVEGKIDGDKLEIVKAELNYFKDKNIDSLILACTHFPVLEDEIKEIMLNVKLIDPAKLMAEELQNILKETNSLNKNGGKIEIYQTGNSANISEIAKKLLERDINIEKLEW